MLSLQKQNNYIGTNKTVWGAKPPWLQPRATLATDSCAVSGLSDEWFFTKKLKSMASPEYSSKTSFAFVKTSWFTLHFYGLRRGPWHSAPLLGMLMIVTDIL